MLSSSYQNSAESRRGGIKTFIYNKLYPINAHCENRRTVNLFFIAAHQQIKKNIALTLFLFINNNKKMIK